MLRGLERKSMKIPAKVISLILTVFLAALYLKKKPTDNT